MPEKLDLVYLDHYAELHKVFNEFVRTLFPNDFGEFHGFTDGLDFLNALQKDQLKNFILTFDFSTMSAALMDLKRQRMLEMTGSVCGVNVNLSVAPDGREVRLFNLLKTRHQIRGVLMVSGSRGAPSEKLCAYWQVGMKVAEGRFAEKPFKLEQLGLLIAEILQETKRFRIPN